MKLEFHGTGTIGQRSVSLACVKVKLASLVLFSHCSNISQKNWRSVPIHDSEMHSVTQNFVPSASLILAHVSSGMENPVFADHEENDEHESRAAGSNDSSLQHRQIGTPIVTCYNTENHEIELGMTESRVDPFGLKSRKKSAQELKKMKSVGSSKKLRKFYTNQNEMIDELLTPLEIDNNAEKLRKQNLKLTLAMYGSVGANVILLVLQLAAATISGSLSLFATMADAFMDLLSSLILLIANYISGKPEIYGYPSGKARFETVGIIIFGTLMSTVSLQLIIHAAWSLFTTPESPEIGILSISFVAIAFFAKLALFLYCRLLDDPTAQILAQDHRNDLLVNSVGLGLAILGAKVNSYLDPIGGMVIALVILRSWMSTVLEHCQLIVGKCADQNFLKKVTYIAMTHDERILQVDTCRAYHSGSKVIVEVDIIFPPETTLQLTHDLGESLQVKLESLPNVERAFVHCDYEATHKPEHRKYD